MCIHAYDTCVDICARACVYIHAYICMNRYIYIYTHQCDCLLTSLVVVAVTVIVRGLPEMADMMLYYFTCGPAYLA